MELNTVELRQLHYFIVIAEELNVTKAAKRLHMAQPPLSRQLKQLENELGLLLFERNNNKRLLLTVEGELFLKRAKEIVQRVEKSVLEVQECKNVTNEKLEIGCTIYCASTVLDKLTLIQKQYPNSTFNIYENEPAHLNELLTEGKIDVAVTTTDLPYQHVKTKTLAPDVFVVAVPKESGYATEKISVAEIASLPLILLRSNREISIYNGIVKEFEKIGVIPNILCECHDSAMLLNLVCRGLGAAIVPYSMLSSFSLEHIKILSVEDNPFVIEPLVTWRTDSYLPKIAQEFLKLF